MKYSKDEFIKEFEYSSERAFYRLLQEGKIVLNENGDFDENMEDNREFCQKRRERLGKQKSKNKKEEPQKAAPKNQKSADQLSLEIDILNAKLEDINNRSELTKIKIQKEKKEVVETAVLNKVIRHAFEEMMKSLTEFPSVCASEIIELVQAEKEPKEALVKYLTSNITTTIKNGLENARQAAKKYYED